MPRLGDCLAALVIGLSDGLVREAIVVDGMSEDGSADLAADMGCKVIIVEPQARGRGAQLSRGYSAASGDWLLFLHGDTVLPDTWVDLVRNHISKSSDKVGYFKLGFDQTGPGPWRVAALANWRGRVLGLPYGDQGLLISRALYDQTGGYGDMPLMEDVDLVRRLGRSRLVQLEGVALTYGSKFVRGGWWAVPLRNLMLLGAYLIGVKPDVLARWYK